MGGRERGYDGGKKVKGRKRHLLVDTLGLLMVVLITSAGLDDGVAAPKLFQLLEAKDVPRRNDICRQQVSPSCASHMDERVVFQKWRWPFLHCRPKA